MTKFRLHVIGLPHTQITKQYEHCAFTANIRKFCIMMKSFGHHITLYGSEDNAAPCDEFVTCISKEDQKRLCNVDGPETILNARYEHNSPHWKLFNEAVIDSLRSRVQPRDFLAIISGTLSQPIIDAFPQAQAVEYAVGYTGVSPKTYRAFASYAWMHTVYGSLYGAHGTRGRFYDRVIPHYIDPEDFQYSAEKDDYLLFIGRLNEDKGIQIAAEVAKEVGLPLVVAGQGPNLPEGVDYRGRVGVEERKKLLSRAKTLFVPSLYLEPFGMVAVEGLISGTPLLTTDWGGLSEINEHGVTGFRCHTKADFVNAAKWVIHGKIKTENCLKKGLTYSIDRIKHEYHAYFQDLYGLWGGGWSSV